MSKSDKIALAVQNAEIQNILEDYQELRTIIDGFTKDFKSLEKVVSNFPETVDNNIKDRLDEIVKCANKLEEGINEATNNAEKNIKEKIKTIEKNTLIEIRKEVDQLKIDAILTIQNSTSKLFDPTIEKFENFIKQAENLKPPKNLMGITVVLCLVCSLLTAGGIFLGNKYINSYRTEQLEHVLIDVDQAARKAANVLTTNQKGKFLKQYERYLGL